MCLSAIYKPQQLGGLGPSGVVASQEKPFSIYRCGVSSVLLNNEPFDHEKFGDQGSGFLQFDAGGIWSLHNGLTACYIHTLLFKK